MGYSRIETPFAGGSQVFPVTFSLGYLNKADVTAYVQGEVDGSGNHAYRAFTWTDADHITVTAPLPNPCVLVTERTVSKNILTGNLGNGGDVTRSTVDRAVRQLMMVTHELMDGRVASFSEIDLLTGFVAAATDAKDIAEAQAALAAADRVLAQAGAASATASAATATTKAGEAGASAAAAAASASAADVTRAGSTPFTGNNSFAGTSTFTGAVSFAAAITAAAVSTWNALATFVAGITTGLINSHAGMLTIKNTAGTETHAVFTDDGSVSLYHNNTKKVETDALGVTVTGRLVETARAAERWHSVSRSVGTWYQNTSGRMIRVAVTNESSALSGSLALGVNDVMSVNPVSWITQGATGSGYYQTAYADVPPGHYYQIAVSGGVSIFNVMELS